jgi:hypothetical protein
MTSHAQSLVHEMPPKDYPRQTPEQICESIEKSVAYTAERYLNCMQVAKSTNDRAKCDEIAILFSRSDAKLYYENNCMGRKM